MIWMWLGFLCLCFWQMWSVFNPDCIFVLTICLILNVRSTTGPLVISIQLFWTQLGAADRKGCTGYAKTSAELNLLPKAKTKSFFGKIRKRDDSPTFLLHCLLQPCAFLVVLRWEKNENKIVKAELLRVFNLVGISSQWASHTKTLLRNFQKTSMVLGVEKLQYVT